jgi:hypothetical protein
VVLVVWSWVSCSGCGCGCGQALTLWGRPAVGSKVGCCVLFVAGSKDAWWSAGLQHTPGRLFHGAKKRAEQSEDAS